MSTVCVIAILSLIGAKGETPAAPVIVSSPLLTDTSTEITIKLSAEDPGKREVAFQIDWGDGTPLSWSRYFGSGMEVEQYHTFRKTGMMKIRARASAHVFIKAETTASGWSRPCSVQVKPSLVKWKFPVDAGTVCSPALDSDGNIYFGDEAGWFRSLTPEGKLRWQFRVGDTMEGAISAAPAIGGGVVYFPCEDEHVYALTLDGKFLWSYKTATPVVAAPAISADGMVYAADDSGVVYCLNNQGILKWQFLTNDEVDNGISIGPDGTIYVPSDSLYAVSPTGSRIWAQGAQEEDNPFFGVSIGPDNDVYATCQDGYLYRLSARDGRIVWRAASPDEDELHGEIAFAPDNTIVFGGDDYYISLKPKDGSPKVLLETEDKVRASPLVNSKGTIYTQSLDGYVYAVRTDGTLLWRKPIAGSELDWAPSSPVIAPDGTVYIGSFDDGFYAFYGDGAPVSDRWSMFRGGPQHTGRAPKAR